MDFERVALYEALHVVVHRSTSLGFPPGFRHHKFVQRRDFFCGELTAIDDLRPMRLEADTFATTFFDRKRQLWKLSDYVKLVSNR